ncbi:MAG: ABC transporter ATP-binding protein [Chloroflexi bacterium]|nr:MAG: ABC transporter ATP-binding protein [Chloroflexota bacterium]
MFQRRKKGEEGQSGRPKPSFRDLGRAIRYLGHYRRMAIFAYLFLFISTGAQLMVPQLVQNVLDAVTNGMIAQQIGAVPASFLPAVLERLGWSAEQFDTFANRPEIALYWALLFIVVFAVARGAFAFSQTFVSEQMSQGVAFDFRNELFEKIQRLSFSYHDRNRTGQLMIRATDDVEKLRGFIGQGLLMAVQALVLLVGTLIILLFTNFRLTLVILPVLPLALILFAVFGAVAQPLFAAVQEKLSRLNTILQENLAGIKVVKAFVREPQEQAKFHVASEDLMNQGITVGKVFSFLFPVIFMLANLGQAAVLYYGGVQIIDSTLTFGEWQKFSLYLIYVFFPIGQLGFIISQMSQASASATRIFEILDTRNEVVNKPDARPLPAISGKLAFENVTFRYFSGGDPVLSNISFDAAPGQTVALLGATGSGKSTVINLIPRFYDVSDGRVTIDGIDVRDVTLESMRSQIGIVLQETNLFTGTIRDNIAFGRPEASDEEVIAAAKAAAAHDFIVGFPGSYDTPVGERGATLSGGQKQRVAIARALLLDPRILILDDSTSSVDLATEALIQRALDKLMQGRTSIVIAQRISTVRNADQIIVLEKGQVVGVGTHTELMETNPIYAEIFSSQLVEDAVVEGAGELILTVE